jgi:hypothetical protein
MSAHDSIIDHLPADGEKVDVTKLSKPLFLLPAIGGVGLVVSIALFFMKPDVYAYSWLFACYFFFTIACGGFFWTLVHNATNSGWGVAVRRVFEHLAGMLPWMFLFFLPIIFLPQLREPLYEWMAKLSHVKETGMDAEAFKHYDYLLYNKGGYLNMPFFYLRRVLYFVCLGGGAYYLRKLSIGQDSSGTVQLTLTARRASCGLLPLFAVSLTFIGIDFIMCLDYTWFSTMWGVQLFAGSALNGMAVIILTVALIKKLGYLKVVNTEHYHLMGKLMKVFVIFWGYITFSQFFLYWYANITEETKFYILRNTGGWYGLSLFIVFGHFVVPFVFLLRQAAKKDVRQICMAAGWILFMHFLEMYWLVIPERGPSIGQELTVSFGLLYDILAFVTVGCLVAYIYLRTLGKHSIYPCRDPRLVESANVIN